MTLTPQEESVLTKIREERTIMVDSNNPRIDVPKLILKYGLEDISTSAEVCVLRFKK